MPGRERVHIDAALSNFAVAYSQQEMFIADQVLKNFPVSKESDKYFEWQLKDIISIPTNVQRADGAEAKEIPWDVSSTAYSAEEYALRDIVTDRARNNADPIFNLNQDTTMTLTDRLKLEREARVAATVFNTTTFTSYTAALSGGDKWDQFDTSDPFGDVKTGRESVRQNALKRANTIIMGQAVFEVVRNHPDLLDRIKYTGSMAQPAQLNEVEMAKAFSVDQVLVGGAVKNSANEGQTVSAADVWGKYVMVCYIAPTPPRKGITLGMTFQAQNFHVARWREDKRKGDMIEVSIVEDDAITVAGAGYLFSTVIS